MAAAPGLGSAGLFAQGFPPPAFPRFQPEAVLAAFAAAYPGRFSAPEQGPGGWFTNLDGRRIEWADGRLLPEGSTEAPSAYDPQPFYPYPDELPPLRSLTAEEKARIEAMARGRDERPPRRDMEIYDRIWGLKDEASARSRMIATRFLGKPLLLHRELVEKLRLVEAEIRRSGESDAEVAAWIRGLGEVDGYYWRKVADTRSLSFHAYGVALDLLPARFGGKAWYWLDAKKAGLPWVELPYEKRLSVPRPVVAAFERRGFIWGGKWLYWDCVHFEYRPEMLVLNGRSVELSR